MSVTIVFDLDDTLLADTGKGVKWFGTSVRALPGALRVLRWCRRQGYRTILYSMGDLESRLRRLDAARIPRDLFRHIYAVPYKNPDAYKTYLGYHQARSTLIYVGDSWKHDVAVALGRADAVVWVQGGRVLGVGSTPPDPENYPVWVIPSVAYLPDILADVLADPYRGEWKEDWQGYWLRQFGRRQASWSSCGRAVSQLTLDLPFGRPSPEVATLAAEVWPFEDWPSGEGPELERPLPEWPVTEADRQNLGFVANPPPDVTPAYLDAYQRHEICGCGDPLLTPGEQESGVCETCLAMGVRTPRP